MEKLRGQEAWAKLIKLGMGIVGVALGVGIWKWLAQKVKHPGLSAADRRKHEMTSSDKDEN